MVKAKGLTWILALQNWSSEVIVEHIGRQWSFLGWISVCVNCLFGFLLLPFDLWIRFWSECFIDAVHQEFGISITSFGTFEGTALVGLEAFLTT